MAKNYYVGSSNSASGKVLAPRDLWLHDNRHIEMENNGMSDNAEWNPLLSCEKARQNV